MPIVRHKFASHSVNIDTEILILGTFNPAIPSGPTFFYGRPRNYLWQLLPGCWGLPSLKDRSLNDKAAFMTRYNVDFVDLIDSVDVPADAESNVNDIFIDPRVNTWKDIIALIGTFAGIRNIRAMVLAIQTHCDNVKIRFCMLPTPARFANAGKQAAWINTIINQTTCPKLVS